jgi:hypothetical protein
MKQRLDTKDQETEAVQVQLTAAAKQAMRLEEVNNRLLSELQGYRERKS